MKPIFVLVFAFITLSSHLPAQDKPAPNQPPNILFCIADDWGAHAGIYGDAWIKTPAFDRVATEGLLFTRAYTPVAKCAPSRAIVLTGRHAWQLEEAGNHLSVFPPKFKGWPEVLSELGWHMGFTGKGWGPGKALDTEGNPRLMTGKAWQKRKLEPHTTGITAIDYAANFTDFLDATPAGKPWCFWYGSLEPHRGFEYQSGALKGGKKTSDIPSVPKQWPDHEIVRHDMLDYAFEVEHTDTHLGRMLTELEKRGLLETTVIIVTSDHGMAFPRSKGYAYEVSNHVPLAIRWPQGIRKPGRVIDDFVSFIDIAPTILDLSGISQKDSRMATITGESWRPLFDSESSGRVIAARDHVLIGKERTDVGRPHDQGYPIRGILEKDWLYLKNDEPDRWPAGNPETGYLDTDGGATKTLILEMGRANRLDPYWQLNFGKRPAEELYHLSQDSDCIHNLASEPDQQKQKQALLTRMETELKAQGDPRQFGKGHLFDSYIPVNHANFYERYLKGDPTAQAKWVNETDFEKEPIQP